MTEVSERRRTYHREYMRGYYARNREKILTQIRERQRAKESARDPIQVKAAKFNLSRERVVELLSQGCSICGVSESKGKHKSLVIDHDHACCPGLRSCGKCVRGALCRQCNTAIGFLNDDLDLLTRAVEYLRR